MNPEIVQDLEKLCDARLLVEYIQLLESYPSVLATACRADSGDDSEGFVSEVELFSSPTNVLEINREVRAVSILDPDGLEFRWPDQLLVIGETGDGDYYCMDLDGEHAGVLQFRHHAVEFEVIADSLQEFVDMLTESFVVGDTSDDDFDDFESEETE
jgi:SMI1 / KNR4 family (SUKH-1)